MEFSIDITDSRVRVVFDSSRPKFMFGAIGIFFLMLISYLSMDSRPDVAAFALGMVFLLLPSLIRWAFPSGESLFVTRTTFAIGRIPFWNFRGRWRYREFPLSSVREVQFKIVRESKGGPVMGIVLFVASKRVKLFVGIEAPEAEEVLNALADFGVDIRRDPEMAMLVEMVNAKRTF